MRNPNGIAIGILAGIAAGLMAIAAFRAGLAALAMLFAAPAAVYLASLGWGTAAGFTAAIVASAAGAITGGFTSVAATAFLLFLPAAWTGHLANLGRPTDHGMQWYPLSDIALRLMIAVAAGFVITGIVLGYDQAELRTAIAGMLREIADANPGELTVGEEDLARSAALYALLIPFVVPAFWLIMHAAIFYISASIARRSGKIARAKDDIPAAANLPFAAAVWPLAGLVGMATAPSPLYEISAIVAGTGIAGFALIGLAELHLVSRGRSGRSLLLFATYLLIVLFTLPLLVLAVMGVARAWRRRPAGGTPPRT